MRFPLLTYGFRVRRVYQHDASGVDQLADQLQFDHVYAHGVESGRAAGAGRCRHSRARAVLPSIRRQSQWQLFGSGHHQPGSAGGQLDGLGPATLLSNDLFGYVDQHTTNYPRRFYRLRSP